MLSKDKQRFDRNGDGRLSGFEYSDYYDYTYGIDDHAKEISVRNEAEDNWSAWLNDAVARLQGNFEDVVAPAELIMGKSAQTRACGKNVYALFDTGSAVRLALARNALCRRRHVHVKQHIHAVSIRRAPHHRLAHIRVHL